MLPLTGLTIAEYFRDVEGQDVLLFIDNIFRFTTSLVQKYLPFWVVCLQPLVTNQPLATEMGQLQERITSI